MNNQATRLRELMERGAAAVSVHQESSSDCASCNIIAVTSGKGGVGKTTLAVNLAMLFAEIPNSRVLIVDADLGLANVDVMLGMSPGRHIGHLLYTNCMPDEVAVMGPGGVMLLSGGSGLQELADSSSKDRCILIEKLCSYFINFDYVIIDTSPGIGSDIMDFLKLAGVILLVTTSEPTSLRDSYAALKTIVRVVPDKQIIPVINSTTVMQAQYAINTLNEVSMKFINWHADCWYQITNDHLVARAIKERRPLVRAYPRTVASICLRELANHLISISRE